jgi:hypothetical protein
MTSSYHEQQWLSQAQSRQQIVLSVLAAALVASAVMTWMLVSAIRESNALQRQMLVAQQAQPEAKTDARRRASGSAARANAQPRRSVSAASAREQRSIERSVREPQPAAQIASTQQYVARHGRQ